MPKYSSSPQPWTESIPPESYGDNLLRWGAALAAASKSLATVFERMSGCHLDGTREMALLAQDPSRLSAAYTAYASRLMQLQAEMQGAMERLQRDGQLLYDNLRQELSNAARAPDTSPMGAPVVAPTMKYGSAASEGVTGPGDWRFDPEQRMPDAVRVTPARSATSPAEDVRSLFSAIVAPWAPSPRPLADTPIPVPDYDGPTPRPDGMTAQEPGSADDADVAASLVDARTAGALDPPRLPAAPTTVYPRPSDSCETPGGVRYRCDAYRRVARAKP